jgi:hypothetical protein
MKISLDMLLRGIKNQNLAVMEFSGVAPLLRLIVLRAINQ